MGCGEWLKARPNKPTQVLLRWQGAEPLNEERLQRAVDFVIQQQPMLLLGQG